jgi:hypothetical protein
MTGCPLALKTEVTARSSQEQCIQYGFVRAASAQALLSITQVGARVDARKANAAPFFSWLGVNLGGFSWYCRPI